MTSRLIAVEAKFAALATVSQIIDMRDFELLGLNSPSNWTSSVVRFQGNDIDSGTFNYINTQAGSPFVTSALAADGVMQFTIDSIVRGIPFIKVVCDTAQTNACSLILFLKPRT